MKTLIVKARVKLIFSLGTVEFWTRYNLLLHLASFEHKDLRPKYKRATNFEFWMPDKLLISLLKEKGEEFHIYPYGERLFYRYKTDEK